MQAMVLNVFRIFPRSSREIKSSLRGNLFVHPWERFLYKGNGRQCVSTSKKHFGSIEQPILCVLFDVSGSTTTWPAI